MELICEHKYCTGCGACDRICPRTAITMEPDKEGFLYPQINQEFCIDCKLCTAVCPSLNMQTTTDEGVISSYAAYIEDHDIRESSSSGGIFTALAESVMSMGGVVFGAAFDKDFSVHHIGISSPANLSKLQGSKYLQSRTEGTFEEVQNMLKDRRQVLYTGTACQIAGLKAFLRQDYPELYTVDILCHGAPSPKVWQMYLKDTEHTRNSKISSVSFRDKTYGWRNFSTSILCDDLTLETVSHDDDKYMQMFLSNLDLRESCYNCLFKKMDRASDLTIGDAWDIEKHHPDMDDDFGTSVVLVHTEKGQELLSSVSDKLCLKEDELDTLLPPCADSRKSVEPHWNREKYLSKIEKGKFSELAKTLEPTAAEKAEKRIRTAGGRVLRKLHLR